MSGYLIVALACAVLLCLLNHPPHGRRDRAPDSVELVVVSCGTCGQDLDHLLGEIRGTRIALPVAQALSIHAAHDCPTAPHHPEETDHP